jgi:hypothetical protein
MFLGYFFHSLKRNRIQLIKIQCSGSTKYSYVFWQIFYFYISKTDILIKFTFLVMKIYKKCARRGKYPLQQCRVQAKFKTKIKIRSMFEKEKEYKIELQ